jgi:hypothetical protein
MQELAMFPDRLYDLQEKASEAHIQAVEAQEKASEANIQAVEAQVAALKVTQYAPCLANIKAQKELFDREQSELLAKIANLEKQGADVAPIRKQVNSWGNKFDQIVKEYGVPYGEIQPVPQSAQSPRRATSEGAMVHHLQPQRDLAPQGAMEPSAQPQRGLTPQGANE